MWFFNCQMMFAILIFDLPIEFSLFLLVLLRCFFMSDSCLVA